MSESDESAVEAGRPAVGIVRFRARCLHRARWVPRPTGRIRRHFIGSCPHVGTQAPHLRAELHANRHYCPRRPQMSLPKEGSSCVDVARQIRASSRCDAVRGALGSGALGPRTAVALWLREAAAFGLLQGRRPWVASWPPGAVSASAGAHCSSFLTPDGLALGLVGAKPDASSRLEADAAHHRRAHPQRTRRGSARGRARRPAGRDPRPLRPRPLQPQQARPPAHAADGRGRDAPAAQGGPRVHRPAAGRRGSRTW